MSCYACWCPFFELAVDHGSVLIVQENKCLAINFESLE